jgi:hypothetical protein
MLRLSRDYANRDVDILMVTGPTDGEGELDLGFDSPIPFCTGAQKLAQRFIILLLNAPDSVFIEPDEGTLVGGLFTTGVIPREQELRGYFILSIKSVYDLIYAEQTDATPDDEYLVDANLHSLDVLNNGTISCKIELELRDNTVYIIPLKIGFV